MKGHSSRLTGENDRNNHLPLGGTKLRRRILHGSRNIISFVESGVQEVLHAVRNCSSVICHVDISVEIDTASSEARVKVPRAMAHTGHER